jgi:hypothetical protein
MRAGHSVLVTGFTARLPACRPSPATVAARGPGPPPGRPACLPGEANENDPVTKLARALLTMNDYIREEPGRLETLANMVAFAATKVGQPEVASPRWPGRSRHSASPPRQALTGLRLQVHSGHPQMS